MKRLTHKNSLPVSNSYDLELMFHIVKPLFLASIHCSTWAKLATKISLLGLLTIWQQVWHYTLLYEGFYFNAILSDTVVNVWTMSNAFLWSLISKTRHCKLTCVITEATDSHNSHAIYHNCRNDNCLQQLMKIMRGKTF